MPSGRSKRDVSSPTSRGDHIFVVWKVRKVFVVCSVNSSVVYQLVGTSRLQVTRLFAWVDLSVFRRADGCSQPLTLVANALRGGLRGAVAGKMALLAAVLEHSVSM
jgi:hypothetical protein